MYPGIERRNSDIVRYYDWFLIAFSRPVCGLSISFSSLVGEGEVVCVVMFLRETPMSAFVFFFVYHDAANRSPYDIEI